MNNGLSSGCPEDCITDDYQLSPTTSPFDFENIDDFQCDANAKHSAIHFFYPSFNYNLIKNHPGSLVKWISIKLKGIISQELRLIVKF